MVVTSGECVRKRYHLIDAIRGIALVNMVLFHLCYDIIVIYSSNRGWASEPLTVLWERFICCTFILVSGISLNFSRHPVKRGLVIFAVSVAVTLVTAFFIPSELILFGVICFFGLAMIICGALKKILEKVPVWFGFLLSAAAFAFTYSVPGGFVGFFGINLFKLPSFLYGCKWFAVLGFPSVDFYSSDYFPLIPWIFLFTAGYYLWKIILKHRLDGFFERRIPVLDFVGRHTLAVYIVHQPIIMGICEIFLNSY